MALEGERPFRVNSRLQAVIKPCPLYPLKADIASSPRHVCFVPCVDGSELARTFFTPQAGRCSHVFGLFGAVHMTAYLGSIPGVASNT